MAPSILHVYETQYEPLALRSRRPNTKRLYRCTLRYFERFLGRKPTLADFTDTTVSAFAAYRLSHGLSKYSVNKDLFNLLAIWRWCHKKQLLKNWPDVPLENPPIRVPVALTREELAALKTAALATTTPPGAAFWLALLLVIWDTAERINAVMGLTWDRVDLRNGWIRFDAEDRKGATADTAARIAPDTIAALKAIKRREGLVFRWPYSRTYLFQHLGRIMQRAGLPNDRLHKFHAIRKSVASYYEAAGGNATELLGHSSRKVTRAYIDPRIVQRATPVDKLFRLGE